MGDARLEAAFAGKPGSYRVCVESLIPGGAGGISCNNAPQPDRNTMP